MSVSHVKCSGFRGTTIVDSGVSLEENQGLWQNDRLTGWAPLDRLLVQIRGGRTAMGKTATIHVVSKPADLGTPPGRRRKATQAVGAITKQAIENFRRGKGVSLQEYARQNDIPWDAK